MTDSNKPPSTPRNDIYGNIDARSESEEGVQAPIPAATVVLLRDGHDGAEVLMLKKNATITFGGMWVFPGGKIDAKDYPAGEVDESALEQAANNAAVRETHEEAGIDVGTDNFVWFSHWTPPPGAPKRFATWFFAAHVKDQHDIQIDDGEIKDHAWIKPADALSKHAAGELDLVPPTWITLHALSLYHTPELIVERLQERSPKIYSTRVVKAGDGNRVALWHGDAGYEHWDASVSGDF